MNIHKLTIERACDICGSTDRVVACEVCGIDMCRKHTREVVVRVVVHEAPREFSIGNQVGARNEGGKICTRCQEAMGKPNEVATTAWRLLKKKAAKKTTILRSS
jgi:hypothetical protein